MGSNKALNGFVAAMLHDVRKIDLNKSGRWERHDDLMCTVNPFLEPGEIDFKALLGEDVVDIIGAHHDGALADVKAQDLAEARSKLDEALKTGKTSLEKIALLLADRWQKAMYQIPESEGFERTKSNPSYYPYYGHWQYWDPELAVGKIQAIADDLSRRNKPKHRDKGRLLEYDGELDLRRIMDVQQHLRRFPHTTYIPHISLEIHHRFTAVLFFFIYQRLLTLSSPLDLEGLSFSLLRISPDPPALFYRLQDVRIARRAIERLRKTLFRKVFVPCRETIPDLNWDLNPFEFFGGDSIVLLWDKPDEIISALQEFVDEDKEVHSIQVEKVEYRLPEGWKIQGGKLEFYADADKVDSSTSWPNIVARKLVSFPTATEARCPRCTQPTSEVELKLDERRGEWLCPDCFAQRRAWAGEIDLERIGQYPDSTPELLAFVFLSLPDDLFGHARAVAEETLIPGFVNRKGLDFGLIYPSPTGFFEYIQAVADLNVLRTALDEEVVKMRQEEGKKEVKAGLRKPPRGKPPEAPVAYVLLASTTRLAYVLRWDHFWRFWGRLNTEREKRNLALSTSLATVFCRPKMPFWSLMDRFAVYSKKGDVYYDASGRSVIMFTPGEINSIRQLAAEARREKIPNAQLQILVQTAQVGSKEELFLEIDARAQERKLGRDRGFSRRLKAALERLTSLGDEDRDREKRAIFIKYIIRLKGGK
jgi:hypothetical protein